MRKIAFPPERNPERWARRYDIAGCIATLQSCAQQENLTRGSETHCYMLRNGFLDSPSAITSLINMYAKCGRIDYAFRVFDSPSPDRNVFAYNSMIAGFVAHSLPERGLDLYREMRESGIAPDKFTFPCLVKGLSELGNDSEVRKIHGLAFKLDLAADVFVGSALINSYLKFGLMQEAEMMFDRLSTRDVVLWNSMVNGYAQTGQFVKAVEIFRRLCEAGVLPSRFTVTGILSVVSEMNDLRNGRAIHGLVVKFGYGTSVPICNALIDMYSKCKSVRDAFEVFTTTEGKDLYTWNSIIATHEACGEYDETLRLFKKMMSYGVGPDLVTVTAILPACSNLAALAHGKSIHGHIIVNGSEYSSEDVLLNNAIMDMYVKCGSMRDALSVFENLRNKDVASWNIVIMGNAMHGHGNAALDLFNRMCQAGFRPDMVTFIGVLSACSHSGYLSQGRELLARMESVYGVVPTVEHYTCVVDMLSRANLLEEAYEIARSMPCMSNSVMWRALLAGSRLHRNVEIAEIASRKVLELEPGHCGSYVLISNTYVAAGRYEDVVDVRDLMMQKDVRKVPGCSWIELKNGIHAFINSDKTHPLTDRIYKELLSLTARLSEHNYVPDI